MTCPRTLPAQLAPGHPVGGEFLNSPHSRLDREDRTSLQAGGRGWEAPGLLLTYGDARADYCAPCPAPRRVGLFALLYPRGQESVTIPAPALLSASL